jgi:hypothetical protein
MTEYNKVEAFGELKIANSEPNYNICFHNNGGEVGKLDFNGPEMVFTGNADESAKVFLNWIAQAFKTRLLQERRVERERCIEMLKELPNDRSN